MKRLIAICLAVPGLAVAAEHADWRDVVREETVSGSSTEEASVDLRTVFNVPKLVDEPALKGFAYSAVGWDPEPETNPGASVRIFATPGMMQGGVFIADGGADLEIATGLEDRGTVDWTHPAISLKVYRLTHVVSVSGVGDDSRTLYGYMDFTDCQIEKATQGQVEAAALGAVTHPLTLAQDEANPWQPIEDDVPQCGIASDATLDAATAASTILSFRSSGRFVCQYRLSGGTLEVLVDGASRSVVSSPVSDWVDFELFFDDYALHRVEFRAHGDGRGGQAAIRGVTLAEPHDDVVSAASGSEFRFDLREGVRKIKSVAALLALTYSATNWTGEPDAGTAPKARVSIVQLAGSGDDLLAWQEVGGTRKVLVESSGEGEFPWDGKRGVWKAEFEIFNKSGVAVHGEEAIFDMRGLHGTLVFVR